MVQGDPQAAKEVQELARQMQQLDPSRFPGNPAMVEQMHREVLSSIDRIELQLQREAPRPKRAPANRTLFRRDIRIQSLSTIGG